MRQRSRSDVAQRTWERHYTVRARRTGPPSTRAGAHGIFRAPRTSASRLGTRRSLRAIPYANAAPVLRAVDGCAVRGAQPGAARAGPRGRGRRRGPGAHGGRRLPEAPRIASSCSVPLGRRRARRGAVGAAVLAAPGRRARGRADLGDARDLDLDPPAAPAARRAARARPTCATCADSSRAQADALLMIGDRAMRMRQHAPGGLHAHARSGRRLAGMDRDSRSCTRCGRCARARSGAQAASYGSFLESSLAAGLARPAGGGAPADRAGLDPGRDGGLSAPVPLPSRAPRTWRGSSASRSLVVEHGLVDERLKQPLHAPHVSESTFELIRGGLVDRPRGRQWRGAKHHGHHARSGLRRSSATIMQFVKVELDPQEAVVAEAGGDDVHRGRASRWTPSSATAPQQQQGGSWESLLGAGKRLLVGESLFMTVFHNESAAEAQGRVRGALSRQDPAAAPGASSAAS